MTAPAAAHCGPDCQGCAPMLAFADSFRARADAISYFTARVHALVGQPHRAAAGQAAPARRAHLSVVPDSAA